MPELIAKLVLPRYDAWITCAPVVSDDVASVAWPATNVTGEPASLPSILNWTEPPGVPPADVTVAVNVTDWPDADGFTDDVTAVVELAWFSVWPPLSVPLLPPKFVEPA